MIETNQSIIKKAVNKAAKATISSVKGRKPAKVTKKKLAPKPIKPKTESVSWYTDNRDCDLSSNPEGLSSIEIIMEWFHQSDNFRRFRGDSGKSNNKETCLGEIKELLHAKGMKHRDLKQIRSKIDRSISAYLVANEWKHSTGQGAGNITDTGEVDENSVLGKEKQNFSYQNQKLKY